MADLSEWALNFHFMAYPCKEKKELGHHVLLRVRRWAREIVTKNRNPDDPLPRVGPLTPTLAERNLSTDQMGPTVALWVGVMPPPTQFHAYYDQANPLWMIRMDNTVRVVVRYTVLQKLEFYALWDPDKEGLCCAFNISREDVFFFEEYRTETTRAPSARWSEWPDIISRFLRHSLSRNDNRSEPLEHFDLERPVNNFGNPERLYHLICLETAFNLVHPDFKVTLMLKSVLLQHFFDVDVENKEGDSLVIADGLKVHRPTTSACDLQLNITDWKTGSVLGSQKCQFDFFSQHRRLCEIPQSERRRRTVQRDSTSFLSLLLVQSLNPK